MLLLPLLQIPSGHHQVADAVSRWLLQMKSDLQIEKVELLSHYNPIIEKIISRTYLKWIHHFPRVYAWTYRQVVYKSEDVELRKYRAYELIFLKEMKEIIDTLAPDLIICTHSFPSYLCSRLKLLGEIALPIINVYTDFIINQLWGIDGIDLHFVPDEDHKKRLQELGVEQQQIMVTGIPVDQAFYRTEKKKEANEETKHILIGGGSIGISITPELLQQFMISKRTHYTILCGRNERLYQEIKNLQLTNVTALPYISSREEMNRLYEQMDAVVTKPGGVTVSECLHKRLPIFIHNALPGQEEMNRAYLINKGLAYDLDMKKQTLEQQLLERLADGAGQMRFQSTVEQYLLNLEWEHALRLLTSRL